MDWDLMRIIIGFWLVVAAAAGAVIASVVWAIVG